VTYKGEKQGAPHKARIAAYEEEFPDRVELYKTAPNRLEKIFAYNQRLLMVN
jgi:hypothetical protein